jgi:hypothetical protein
MWRSFAANYVTASLKDSTNYDIHGHVGFAWGSHRSSLEKVPLYDKALIGGADHIIAHAAAGQIPHECITKSFTEDLDEVLAWSKKFYAEMRGRLDYVPGDLYHLWHGNIDKRQYLRRIKEFTPLSKTITERDANGLYVNRGDDSYMRNYYRQREAVSYSDFDGFDDGFESNMGYNLADLMPTPQPVAPLEDISPLPDVDSTPVEATYTPAPDADSTPVEPSYTQPDVDTTPVEASYSQSDVDSTPVEASYSNDVASTPVEASYESGNFS